MAPQTKERDNHSIEAEQAVLGAVLMHNDVYEAVSGIVEAAHFFEPIHREIFDIAGTLIRAGKAANAITMVPFIAAGFDLGGVTVRQYVARLAAAGAEGFNVKDFARTVRDLADRRTIHDLGDHLKNAAAPDVAELASWGVDVLDGIVAERSMNAAPAVMMNEAIMHAVDKTATAYQNEGRLIGIPTGLRDLDQKTLGAHPGNLIVIAGRPGMGKTALAVTIARNKAKAGYKGVFFSLEMGDDELAMRMISDECFDTGKVEYWQIRSGKYHERYFDHIREAALRLKDLPLKIEQQPFLNVGQIAARARQFKRRYGLDYMVIDHLLLIKGSDRYRGNRVYELGEITGALKGLAKELGVPVYLLTQLSRGVEQREDKRPVLSDLRDSGAIEQDADTVIFLYRPAYYLEQREPLAGSSDFLVWADEMDKVADRLDAIIAKQRSGPLGTVRLFCNIGSNAIRDKLGDMEMPSALMTPDDNKVEMK